MFFNLGIITLSNIATKSLFQGRPADRGLCSAAQRTHELRTSSSSHGIAFSGDDDCDDDDSNSYSGGGGDDDYGGGGINGEAAAAATATAVVGGPVVSFPPIFLSLRKYQKKSFAVSCANNIKKQVDHGLTGGSAFDNDLFPPPPPRSP